MKDAVERIQKRAEFRRRVKLAHDAIDEFAESRLGSNDWFVRDLESKTEQAVRNMLDFGTEPNDPLGDRTFSE